MNFNSIWSQFNWVIDKMKEGMCFFEGYIPGIGQDDLLFSLSELIRRTRIQSFKSSVWSNDISEAEREKEYTPSQYVELFHTNKIVLLGFYYELETDIVVINQKLMFEKTKAATALEIICYREPILGSNNPKEAVRSAIREFQHLNHLFKGNALFIGPDTLSYPTSSTEYPNEWLRIE